MEEEETKKRGSSRKGKAERELEELTCLLQHLQADFENYKKRIQLDADCNLKNSNRLLITDLLPILDSLELAIKNKDRQEEFVKGVELIYAQFMDTLEKQGLRQVKEDKFDPRVHEALMQKEANVEPGTILEEFQKGYTLNGILIRPARVMVSKKGEQ